MINWIKLDINILDDAKIKIIRSHPDGNSVVILWIGLLCLAMKSTRPGVIEISDGLPYTIDDLSNLFNLEKKTTELGIALLVKYRMIEIFEGGCIEIINFSKHQNIEQIKRNNELTRVRMIKYRTKQKDVTRNGVTITTTDLDKDIDKDKRLVEKTDKRVTFYSSSFISFWKTYPNKVGKDAAWNAWKKRKGSLPDIDFILTAIEKQKKSAAWVKESGQYIPNPATWINQGRWMDEGKEIKDSW
jgi:predicted phage replisome organizer